MAFHFNAVRDMATAVFFEPMFPEATTPLEFLMKFLAYTAPGSDKWMDAEDFVMSAEVNFHWLVRTLFDSVAYPRLWAAGDLARQYTFVIGLESVAGEFATMSYHLKAKTQDVAEFRFIGKKTTSAVKAGKATAGVKGTAGIKGTAGMKGK